jgi:hypothetical protein
MCGNMTQPSARFAELLTTAVRTIAAHENRTVAAVQDELGYSLGRETGGSAIEYWRKGHIPADPRDVEKLAAELVKRSGLNQDECEQFLRCARYPYLKDMADQLFPSTAKEPSIREWAPPEISPFVVGPPITMPRQFFGRERELKRIFGLWRRFPLQNLAVIGSKRSGKTSLLHYLKNITRAEPAGVRPDQRTDWLPQPERYQWVFVDFQDARMGNRDRLLRHLLFNLDMRVPNMCDLDTFMDIVSHRLNTPAVILMDEIGAGLASSELDEPFWWSLRSLVSHYTQGNLAFLLTSHTSPAQLAQDAGKPSPFFNIFQVLELGPFTDVEARELIASSPISFSPDDVNWILDQSGRWPCLLQILCQTRLTALEEGETNDDWRELALCQIAPFRYLLE